HVLPQPQNGPQALEKYKQTSPHLLTMHITIPQIHPITPLKQIKQIHPSPKIIISSPIPQQSILIHPIQPPPKHFILNPFHPHPVLQPIDKTLP
ncbi:response regulator, partial [Bacillus altitudinis]|uniref:response regulator n=1 Tax=Bacillus altitudinis TaxID=293387 RepID=UPI0011A78691